MSNDDDHKDFVLSALRSASLRARMYEIEIQSIGIALKGDMVSVIEALKWIKDIGAWELIGKIPDEIVETAEKNAGG
jgi:hypothetical protein